MISTWTSERQGTVPGNLATRNTCYHIWGNIRGLISELMDGESLPPHSVLHKFIISDIVWFDHRFTTIIARSSTMACFVSAEVHLLGPTHPSTPAGLLLLLILIVFYHGQLQRCITIAGRFEAVRQAHEEPWWMVHCISITYRLLNMNCCKATPKRVFLSLCSKPLQNLSQT